MLCRDKYQTLEDQQIAEVRSNHLTALPSASYPFLILKKGTKLYWHTLFFSQDIGCNDIFSNPLQRMRQAAVNQTLIFLSCS